MKRFALCCIWVGLLAVTLQAQPQSEKKSAPSEDQKGDQKMGQRLFQQRCSVCHLASARSTKSYAPKLYKDRIEDNEDTVRETILNGRPGLMPGWKYTLEPKQIDAIIEYLKTVENPAAQKN